MDEEFEDFSDEELQAIAGQSQSESDDFSDFSDEELSSIANGGASRSWGDEGPGWLDTAGKSMALGFAKLGEGIGSTMESLEDESFFGTGIQPGKYIRESAEPYVTGTEDYLKAVPQDSWKKTFSHGVEGLSSFLPTLPFAPGIKSMIGLGAANRFGQKRAQLQREGAEDPTAGGLTAAAAGLPIDAFQFSPMFNQFLTPFAKTVASGVTGSLGAGAEVPSQMYADYVGGGREYPPTMDEVMEALPEPMLLGGGQGMVVGGIQAERQAARDYFSDRAMQAKAGEYSAKLDAMKAEDVAAAERMSPMEGAEPQSAESLAIEQATGGLDQPLPEPIRDPIVAREKFLNEAKIDADDSLLQLDNSSDVFPEGIKKPFSEPEGPAVTPSETAKIVAEGANIKDTQGMDSVLGAKELDDKIKTKEKETARKLSEAEENAKPDLPNPFTFKGFKDLAGRLKKSGYEGNPEYYNFFKNKRNVLASEITKADKFPLYRKNHDIALKHFETENVIAWDHAQSLRPFTLLNAKEKLNATAAMYELSKRGAEGDSSPQALKRLGLSDREILGIGSVRNTLDNALEMLRKEGVTRLERQQGPEESKAIALDELNKSIDDLKASNYVPTGRYGKYGLTLYNQDGTVSEFIMGNSRGRLLKTLSSKLKNNPELNPETSKVNKVAVPLGSEYVGAHPDILDALGDTEAHIPSAGFLNRLKRRKNVEGFEWDLQRNLASYLSSHARYMAGQETKRGFNDLNKQFDAFYSTLGNRDKTLYTGLRQNIGDLQKYVMTPSKNVEGLGKFLASYYLANNVKTNVVNTMSFLNAYANAARYTGVKGLTLNPEIALAKSVGQTAKYYGGKMLGKIEGVVGKDLYASLEQARKEGVVGGNRVLKDLLQDAGSPHANFSALGQKMSTQDVMFLLNQVSEDFVRTNTYIMGWNIYDKSIPFFKKNDIELPDRHNFAKRFVREVQADYTKAGTPDIAKNPVGKIGSTFRLWHHAFFTMLKKSVMEKNIGAIGRFAGVLGSLGGVYATPFVGGILKALKQAGFNPDKAIKDSTPWDDPKDERAALFGQPTKEPFNVNIAGAISPDIIPSQLAGGDVVSGLGRAFLGVLADPFDRASKANFFINEKGDIGRGLEQLLPRAFNIQDIATSQRWKKEGVRDSSGNDILGRPVTEGEVTRKALGFMPDTVSKAYDRRQALERAEKELDNENINRKIALRAFRGEPFQDLVDYANENGIPISSDSISEMVQSMKSRDLYEKRRLGKRGSSKLDEINREFPDS